MDIDYEKYKALLAKQKINIHLGRDWVADNDKLSFTSPLLLKSSTKPKELLKFLKNSNSLDVNIVNRKPKQFRVHYSGTIKNDKGDVLNFIDVDNGFCVNLG